MTLEKKEMDGSETAMRGAARPVLELEVGQKVRVAMRGGGTYKGGDARDFKKEGHPLIEGVKLENAEIVVCNPDDPGEIYVMSGLIAPEGTTWGRSILGLLRPVEGVFCLDSKFGKDEYDLLNAIGYVGKTEEDTGKGYENTMKFLTWDVEMKKGKVVYMPGDLAPETVGAAQREDMDVEEGKEAVEM